MSGATEVIVVGQTPPPTHGQAVMVAALMRLRDPEVTLHLVRLDLSKDLAEVGRVRLGKLVGLVSVCRRVLLAQRQHSASVLYVAIGGASLVPLIRDVALLAVTRRRFDRVVLHIHGAGIGAVIEGLPAPLRRGVQALIGRPSVVVALTPFSPPDARGLRARSTVTIPNGIPELPPPRQLDEGLVESLDEGPDEAFTARRGGEPGAESLAVLFVGTLVESKGVLVLIEAVALLRGRGLDVRATLAGGTGSEDFAARMHDAIAEHGLGEFVTTPGHLDEAAKQRAYGCHDVFAFPSYYEGENQSVAMLEAMRAGLPLVAADWRGAPFLTDAGAGMLVPPHDAPALADALAGLLADPAGRARLGAAGRERYLEEFTESQFLDRFGRLFRQALPGEVAR